MFTRILLENFLSFEHLDLDLAGPRGVPLRYALVYGENGSGKTNLMQSVSFLRDTVTTLVPEVPDGSADPRALSRLRSEHVMIGADGPMHIRYEFVIGGRRGDYDIVFGADGELFREELRFRTPKGNVGRYFLAERDGDGVSVSLGRDVFRGGLSKTVRADIGRYWGRHTALAVVHRAQVGMSADFLGRWGFEGMSEVLGFILSVSTNASGGRAPAAMPRLEDLEQGTVDASESGVLDSYEEAVSSFFTRLCSDVRGMRYERWDEGGRIGYRLVSERMVAGRVRAVPLSRESSGNRKLLEILPHLMACSVGGVSFIDEIDSGIHDRMIRDLMLQVLPDIGGQMVVTTHNTSLLESVDPRHLFVIRIDRKGYKDIVPFSSVAGTHANNNNRVRYNKGVFEGIPYIGDVGLRDIAGELCQGARG